MKSRTSSINKDLNRYLYKRRREEDYQNLKPLQEQEEQEEPEENNLDMSPQQSTVLAPKPANKADKEAKEDFEQVEIEEKEFEKPFFARLFDRFLQRKAENVEAEYEKANGMDNVVESRMQPSQVDTSDDFKSALKIALSAMENMKPSDLRKFKETEHFKNYKGLLQKHNIKKL